jgi:hypothetical protein
MSEEIVNREPVTHDYTVSNWGHSFVTTELKDGGKLMTGMGFGHGVSEGDYLIFKQKDGSTTRYQVEEIHYKLDPKDMWSAVLVFAPRPFNV